MEIYEVRVCKHCSPKCYDTESNHEQERYKDIVIWRCCSCDFETYYREDGTQISKEEVFRLYPELLEQKKRRLEELRKTRCDTKCSRNGSGGMWCWNLPWCFCEVKTLREEVEGVCSEPLSAKEHVDDVLLRNSES